MSTNTPEIQLISNVVVRDESGRVLFLLDKADGQRWWLPGEDLTAFQHPEERAKQVLDRLSWLSWDQIELVKVQSFRGRRGWHVMFDYLVKGSGQPTDESAAWFAVGEFPRTMHGQWEAETVSAVLASRPVGD